uniref:Bis(5'-nucleosyl)-tetraphosphatase [asymmetrical] n=1 Tax=Ditylenchus dipsaci TaxID=166011 RepID=A0A915DSY1_9BILA
MQYPVKGKQKEVTYFIAHYLGPEQLEMSEEHTVYKWAPLKEAIEFVSFEPMKSMLIAADNYISTHANASINPKWKLTAVAFFLLAFSHSSSLLDSLPFATLLPLAPTEEATCIRNTGNTRSTANILYSANFVHKRKSGRLNVEMMV